MTGRQRPSASSAAFGRALTTPTRPEPLTEPENTPEAASNSEPRPAFTVRFDTTDTRMFNRLTLEVSNQLGRPVRKSDLVRVLVALAADDPTLRNQVAEELRGRRS